MIKFVASDDAGRRTIGLILSGGNLQRLREGKPIHVHLEELNLPWKGEILIAFGGESEEELKALVAKMAPRSRVVKTPGDDA